MKDENEVKQTADFTLDDILEIINTNNPDIISHYKWAISNNKEWQKYVKERTKNTCNYLFD